MQVIYSLHHQLDESFFPKGFNDLKFFASYADQKAFHQEGLFELN
jgi:hypothetical protein